MLRDIAYYLIKIVMKAKNRHIWLGRGTRIKPTSIFEGYNKIHDKAFFSGEIGLCSYIGNGSIVSGKIGRFCSIADGVVFLTKTHPVRDFVSTHPSFYSLKKQAGITFVRKQKFTEEPTYGDENASIIIGNDVYIGYGATLIGPVKVGDGAVIAAKSLVTSDIPPYAVVGGVPAKLIRYRFAEEQIEYLLKTKWWNNSLDWISRNADKFESVDNLIQVLKDST